MAEIPQEAGTYVADAGTGSVAIIVVMSREKADEKVHLVPSLDEDEKPILDAEEKPVMVNSVPTQQERWGWYLREARERLDENQQSVNAAPLDDAEAAEKDATTARFVKLRAAEPKDALEK